MDRSVQEHLDKSMLGSQCRVWGFWGSVWKLLCDEGTVLGSRRVVKPQGCLKGDEFVWSVFQGMFRARLIELCGREEL